MNISVHSSLPQQYPSLPQNGLSQSTLPKKPSTPHPTTPVPTPPPCVSTSKANISLQLRPGHCQPTSACITTPLIPAPQVILLPSLLSSRAQSSLPRNALL